ncbi:MULTISPECIES: slipin family protein [unclassified Nitrospina]|uniref:slipin family protein n=1 Tax=unclassified Nitrospina TaxID=2638683 RepID=UPI003F9511FB
MNGFIVGLIILLVILFSAFKVLREYERGVIFLLGKFYKVKGPGLILVIPILQQMVKVSLRTVVMDVPPQDIITRDNVTVRVNAVVYFRVIDPQRAIIDVEDYLYATQQLSQTTLRSVLGKSQLDDLLAHREKINEHLQQVIDQQTEPWGVKVANVELKNVDLPTEMQRALAKQAEAERERRAKVIHAEGEFEASKRISDAADVINAHPPALQLRFLQTMVDLSVDKTSMVFFPFPLEMLQSLVGAPKTDDNNPGTA